MTIRVQIGFPEEQPGVGADVFQNTWHIDSKGGAAELTAAQDFRGEIDTFYSALQTLLSSEIIGGLATYKAYFLGDPEPRSPIMDDSIDISPASAGALPPQLAVCLSYRSVFESGAPKARRRGRIYLGGWNSSAVNASTGGVATAVTTAINGAAADLLAASDASSTWRWVVWSPTDATSRAVTGGWVDDAWDVVRRRKLELTTRENFGVGH